MAQVRRFFLILSAAFFAACGSSDPIVASMANLEVDIMPPPTDESVVNQRDTIALFPLTADAGIDEIVTAIAFTGQADIGSGWNPADFDRVVTNCGIYDMGVQQGTNVAPDPATGVMRFAPLAITLPAGTSRTLSLECEMDGSVDGVSGDRIAVGVASDIDVTATDMLGAPSLVTVTDSARREAGAIAGMVPADPVTVLASGNAELARAASSPSGIASRGADLTILTVASVSVGPEDAPASRLRLRWTGSYTGSIDLGLLIDGREVERVTLDVATDAEFDVAASGSDWVFGRDQNHEFAIATSIPDGSASYGVGIVGSATSSPWDGSYAGFINLAAVGADSGASLGMPVPASEADNLVGGAANVLRTSRPIVEVADLPVETPVVGTTLMNAFRFSVRADDAGDVALKRFTIRVDRAGSAGGFTWFGGRLQVLVDGVPLTEEEARIEDNNGYSLYTEPLGLIDREVGYIIVTFVSERRLTATPLTIELNLHFEGTIEPGEIIRFSLESGGTGSTGSLSSDVSMLDTYAGPGPHIDTGSGIVVGRFIWSAFDAGGSHSDALGVDGGSADWMDDYGVTDRTIVRTYMN
jgi:hypothetical protein